VSVDDLVELVKGWGNRNVTITGGEPFMQERALYRLLIKLEREGYRVSVETNGSYKFLPFDAVDYVVDYKLPSSGEGGKMKTYLPWLELKNTDWIKFVIQNDGDYSAAVRRMRWLEAEGCFAQFAMSPILESVSVNSLLSWLQADHISNVVVSVQLHKLLKLDEAP